MCVDSPIDRLELANLYNAGSHLCDVIKVIILDNYAIIVGDSRNTQEDIRCRPEQNASHMRSVPIIIRFWVETVRKALAAIVSDSPFIYSLYDFRVTKVHSGVDYCNFDRSKRVWIILFDRSLYLLESEKPIVCRVPEQPR